MEVDNFLWNSYFVNWIWQQIWTTLRRKKVLKSIQLAEKYKEIISFNQTIIWTSKAEYLHFLSHNIFETVWFETVKHFFK